MTRLPRLGLGIAALLAGAAALAVFVPPLDYDGLVAHFGPAFAERLLWTFGTGGTPHATARAAVLLSSVALVLSGLAAIGAGLGVRGLAPRPPAWRAALATGVLFATLVPTLSGGPYVAQTLWGTAGVLLLGAGLLLLPGDVAGRVGSLGERGAALLSRIANAPPLVFGSLLFFTTAFVAAGITLALFHGIPPGSDGAIQLFQARVFASGRVAAPAPRLPEFFQMDLAMVVQDGRWYPITPPGYAVVLALGVLAGASWLVNPVLGGLAAVATWRAGAAIAGEGTGRLAGLLVLLSPFVLIMSANYQNHAASMLAFAVFLVFAARLVKNGSAWSGAAAGLAAGLLVWTRPYSAVALLVPAGIGILLLARRALPLRGIAALLAAGGACVALLLGYNSSTTGSPWVFGYQRLLGARNNPGFGHSAYGPALTVPLAFEHSFTSAAALERNLFEWPIPSLAFVLFLLASRRAGRWDALLGACAASLFVAHFFFWGFGIYFGPRFLFESVPCLAILTARGLVEARSALAVREASLAGLVPAALVAFTLWAFAMPVPFLGRIYANRYFGGDDRAVAAARAAGLENALVLVTSYYPSAFSQNTPGLDGPVVYARDRPDRGRLVALYPGRSVWREAAGKLVRLR